MTVLTFREWKEAKDEGRERRFLRCYFDVMLSSIYVINLPDRNDL